MRNISIFDLKFKDLVKDGINFLKLDVSDEKVTDLKNEPVKEIEAYQTDPSILSCSHCNVVFKDIIEQRAHYKSDWHRYNLRQAAHSKDPLTLEQFNEELEKSSATTSSSESDSENFDLQNELLTSQGKVFLKTSGDLVISLYQSLILHKKNSADVNVKDRLEKYNEKTLCGVFMLGGGRFSGAIFEGIKPIKHKTFHCYTVRAGQGGAQSACDNRLGSNPKSAGSSLRRYNEQALKQHVSDITSQWSEDIEKCDLIFYKAPGPYNQSVLFGGKKPILDRMDSRVRSIPLSTRKATFAELKRIFHLLTTAATYESEQVTLQWIFDQKLNLAEAIKRKKKSKKVNRSKSREGTDRPDPCPSSPSPSDNSSEDAIEFVSADQNIGFEESLQEFDDSLTSEERQRHQKKKKKKPRTNRKARLKEKDEQEKDDIITIIGNGDLERLKSYLSDKTKNEETTGEKEKVDDAINLVLDGDNNTLLHVAAKNEKPEMVLFLLENGADPCLINSRQKTPYDCTQNKDVRDIFKEFSKAHPEINNIMESAEEKEEKKKARKKLKRDKKKAKDLENKLKAEEEAERQRFLNLSDREKMALAAVKRIMDKGGSVLVRCFLCGADITGKVPFEYSGNLFCSVDCLKGHRYKNPINFSC